MIPRILINASNLHVGGGIQVASSFILELSKILDRMPSCELVIYVSNAVFINLTSSGFDMTQFNNFQIFDVFGLECLTYNYAKKFYVFSLVFTIFGPLYLPRRISNNVVGFAQSWIIYPENEISQRMSLRKKWLLRLKYIIQWRFFSRAQRLIVELEHVKNGLVKKKSFPSTNIDIVPNCVSSLYFDKSQWVKVNGLENLTNDVVNIGYVTRDYPHKNIDFLFNVALVLRRISKLKYRFFVTLTEDEWERHSPEFKELLFNIGPLNVAQCPTFYEAMDGVIFPSLIESFSATPLEAMAMRCRLFASDRDFVRDCCGVNAIYFDPLDAEQAGQMIDDWFCFTPLELREVLLDHAYIHLRSLPTSKDRAIAYVEIIKRQLIL